MLIGAPSPPRCVLFSIWGTGQDQCATIKRQLCSLLPDVRIFLDVRVATPSRAPCDMLLLPQRSMCLRWQVDDLKSIDALEQYIEETAVVLIFVSKGYFKSINVRFAIRPHPAPCTASLRRTPAVPLTQCLREVRCAVSKNKFITLVHDPVRGGASVDDIKKEECPADLLSHVFESRQIILWQRIKVCPSLLTLVYLDWPSVGPSPLQVFPKETH